MSSSFITNKEKFLSDIINGILPKTNAVDILVGYFYFSGYVQLSDNLKNKQIRILVGLDVDLQISGHICEVEAIRKRFPSSVMQDRTVQSVWMPFIKPNI